MWTYPIILPDPTRHPQRAKRSLGTYAKSEYGHDCTGWLYSCSKIREVPSNGVAREKLLSPREAPRATGCPFGFDRATKRQCTSSERSLR